MLSSQQKCL